MKKLRHRHREVGDAGGRGKTRGPGFQDEGEPVFEIGPKRLLILPLFLLAAITNREAQLAGVARVKGFCDRARQSFRLGEINDHAGPGDRLQRNPMPSQRGHDGHQAEDITDCFGKLFHVDLLLRMTAPARFDHELA